MKVLVTGCRGFIGSNLTDELLKKGNIVVGIDKARKDRITFRENKNFFMICEDINYIERYLYELSDVDTIYHLAASADIKNSLDDTKTDLENNTIGTHSILELMRKKDIKNIVFSSSSAVYGVSNDIPTKETSELKPISVYGASKVSAESFIRAYCDLYGLKAWIFRFAQVVGRFEHRGVIIDFYNKLKKNTDTLEILGDGKQEKSYFDVQDCVNAMTQIQSCKSGVYNLGNKDTTKVERIAEIVSGEMFASPEFNFTGGKTGWKGDTPYCILDISKALSTGWKPKFNSESSIRRTVRYLLNE